MRPLHFVHAFIIALALSGCAPEEETSLPITGSEALAEIQAASEVYSRAFLAGDADAVSDLMTLEAVASPVDLADIKGRENLRAFFQNVFEDMTVSAYTFVVVEAEIFGDIAYDRGAFLWESSWQGQPPTQSRGRFNAVRHRGTDGIWRIHRLLENESPGAN